MNKMQEQVREFHLVFGHPVEDKPTLPTEEIRRLRIKLIQEEADEFEDASNLGDIVDVADALGDLLVVINGAALCWGIDLEPIFDEIHRSNMSKRNADGSVLRRSDGKILKGSLYTPPELARIILQQQGAKL